MDSLISYTFACTRYLYPLGFAEDIIHIIVKYCVQSCKCLCGTFLCSKYRYHRNESESYDALHLCEDCNAFMIDGNYHIDLNFITKNVNTTPGKALYELKKDGHIGATLDRLINEVTC